MSKLHHDFVFNSTILIAVKELVEIFKRQGTLDHDTLNKLEEITDEEDDSNDGPIALLPEHLMGAFTILFFGVTLSSFFFIIEHITNTAFFTTYYSKLKMKLPKLNCKLKVHKVKKSVSKVFPKKDLKLKRRIRKFFKRIKNLTFYKKYFTNLKLNLTKLKSKFKIFKKKKPKKDLKLMKRRARKFVHRVVKFSPTIRQFS